MKKILFLLAVFIVALTSCLKDKPNTNFSNLSTITELVESGKAYFSQDAITSAADTVVIPIQVNVASPNPPTSDVTVNLAVDNSLIIADPAVGYVTMPTTAYNLSATTVIVKAGQRLANVTLTIYKKLLDPSKSYQLPVKIASVSTGIISGNLGVHYYHIIGNDFAGTYSYQYRRYQNGTGPGIGAIPSLGQGSKPDIDNGTTATTILSPVSPTEFKMVTNYNGQGVMYDVTFTRTVTSSGVINYTNWAVKFLDVDIAKWTTAGITNMVSPKFTIPPPENSTSAKIFELNYVSGGASPRYIDDTYHK